MTKNFLDKLRAQSAVVCIRLFGVCVYMNKTTRQMDGRQ